MSEQRPFGYEPYAAPATARGRPRVIGWFRLYAVVMAAFYALVIPEILFWPDLHHGMSAVGLGVVIGAAGAVSALHGLGALVPYKPWGWMLGVGVLGLGLMGCTAIFTVPLMIYWFRPITKAAFGRL